MNIISKWSLIQAFLTGSPLPRYGFVVINKIERESGSNDSYMVTGYNAQGEEMTKHLTTLD